MLALSQSIWAGQFGVARLLGAGNVRNVFHTPCHTADYTGISRMNHWMIHRPTDNIVWTWEGSYGSMQRFWAHVLNRKCLGFPLCGMKSRPTLRGRARSRARREQLERLRWLLTTSPGQNLAWTVLYVPYLLDSRSGLDTREACVAPLLSFRGHQPS